MTDPAKCPCQSDVDDPGPHIPSCPYNDPNYDAEPPDPALVLGVLIGRADNLRKRLRTN